MKKFIKNLSFVFIIALIFVSLVGCDNSKKEDNTDNKNEEMIADVVEENGIGLKMTRLSTGSSSGVSITATVLPSNATDKTLTWNLEWVERTGYSASNYTLSNFVSKVVSSNTLNCNITLLKRFPMQIKVTVASKTNSDVSASCLLDCYSVMDFNAKEGGAQFELSYSVDSVGNKYEIFGCSDLDSEIVLEGMTYDSIFNTGDASFNSITEEEIIDCYGTIKTTESYVVLIGLSSSLKSMLEAKGITFNDDYTILKTNRVDGYLSDLITNFTSNKDTILNILNSTNNWFELYISFTNTYNGSTVNYVEKVIQLKGFSVADYYSNVSVKSIVLDKENIIL